MGKRRWTTFTTPDWLKECLTLGKDRRACVLGDGFVIVDYISRENIEAAVGEMDQENKLMEYTNSLNL